MTSLRLAAFGAATALAFGATAHAASVTSSSVFATGTAVGATQPDSLTTTGGSIWAEYGNGASSTDYTGTSTVVQYAPTGTVLNTYAISGSVDGLKANPVTGQIWALQNQDGNSRLSLITPGSPAVAGPFSYGPPYVYGANSSRGYDDAAFLNGQVYLSYTNPTGPSDPVVQQLTNGNTPSGTLTTTNVLNAGATGLSTPDIDSLKTTPGGSLVVSSGDQARYTVISNPGTASQSVASVQLTAPGGATVSGLDDVLFPSASSGTLYVSSTGTNQILALVLSGLNPNNPIVSVGSLNELAIADPATGLLTPLFTSSALSSPHGLAFVPTPEPATLGLVAAGLLGLLGLRRRAS